MACRNFDEDIFSPVRFDSSVADSIINSGDSSIHFDLGFLSKDSPINKCAFEASGAKGKDHAKEFSSSLECIVRKAPSDVSNSLMTTTKDSSEVSTNSEELSTDLLPSSLNKKRVTKDKNTLAKENSGEVLVSQYKAQLSKQRVTNKTSSEQNCVKEKKPVRPTTLLTSESSSVNGKEKGDNALMRKSRSSKNTRNKEKGPKENSVDAFEKNSQNVKTAHSSKIRLASVKQTVVGNKIKIEDGKSEDQQCECGKLVSNPLFQSEKEVIEKMVHDTVSFECDKIRQNIYSQQMSFYKQINKIKNEMEKQHLDTTERLCKTIEELMQINVFLKENKL